MSDKNLQIGAIVFGPPISHPTASEFLSRNLDTLKADAALVETLSQQLDNAIQDRDEVLSDYLKLSSKTTSQRSEIDGLRRDLETSMRWVPVGREEIPHYGDMIVMCDDGIWYAGHYDPNIGRWEDLDCMTLPGNVIAWLDIIPYGESSAS